ncbi:MULTISPECIES: hypothetical protein [unclassified Corynebacterium]|uniref:hypothetical protein n=1 Tax=unclassified Corynebacterium TaxID=2624378 RepID=UPI0029CA2105|nr:MULTISPECIES: hypothetical protein [unclassified Corynebacterium]WPF66705.1 hypothetical protein OLX12_02950 [Corynebacterium sp. 22KM0430]WPF69193.1 hypothetical protein OLW90_02945 [Corynebacterium sp. 21KM1197]
MTTTIHALDLPSATANLYGFIFWAILLGIPIVAFIKAKGIISRFLAAIFILPFSAILAFGWGFFGMVFAFSGAIIEKTNENYTELHNKNVLESGEGTLIPTPTSDPNENSYQE